MEDASHTGGLVPVSVAMRRAMAEREETFRSLETRTAEIGVRGGRGLTSSYMGAIARGEQRASIEALEGICAALELDPHTIAEYRLAITRRLFDERPSPLGVGLDEAIMNLYQYDAAETLKRLGDAADPEGRADAGERERPEGQDDQDSPETGTEGPAR